MNCSQVLNSALCRRLAWIVKNPIIIWKGLKTMDGHLVLGLFACIGLFFFFVMKGRTRDGVSIVAVALGCVAIIVVVLNWDALTHLSSFNFSNPLRHAA